MVGDSRLQYKWIQILVELYLNTISFACTLLKYP